MVRYDEKTDQIREIVESMALSKYKSFYPDHIKSLMPELSLEEIVEKLEPMTQKGAIILRFEVRCPETYTVLKIVDDYTEIIGTEVYCRDCGEEVYIDEACICPKYFINDEYRNCLKKKNLEKKIYVRN